MRSKSLLILYIPDFTRKLKDTLFSLPEFKKKSQHCFLEKEPNGDLSWQPSVHTYEHVQGCVLYRRTLQTFSSGIKKGNLRFVEYQSRIETENNCKGS